MVILSLTSVSTPITFISAEIPDASIDIFIHRFNTGDSWVGLQGGYVDIYKNPVDAPAGFNWVHDVIDDASVSYIAYMAHRFLEIQRVLKPTGHFFLHCDYREVGNLRVLGDYIFDKARFRGEIIWSYPKHTLGSNQRSTSRPLVSIILTSGGGCAMRRSIRSLPPTHLNKSARYIISKMLIIGGIVRVLKKGVRANTLMSSRVFRCWMCGLLTLRLHLKGLGTQRRNPYRF